MRFQRLLSKGSLLLLAAASTSTWLDATSAQVLVDRPVGPAKSASSQDDSRVDNSISQNENSVATGEQPHGQNAGFLAPIVQPGDTPDTGSLEELEAMALGASPAVRQIQAELEGLRGKMTQAGLPPNPTVGVMGEDINEDGGSGKYGVFLGREIITGNKLGLSQSVVGAEIEAAERRLATVRQKLLTDVRQRFYELLVAQERVLVATELVGVTHSAVDTSRKLFDAKETPQTAVLQAELELESSNVILRQAENERVSAVRKLAGLLGEATLPVDHVDGNLSDTETVGDFEQYFDRLIGTSPEIAESTAEVERARRQLERECAEPIPNVTWQANILYDTVAENVVTAFQVGMPIPTANRNQGAIRQAQEQVNTAQHRLDKQVLGLRQRLASAYEVYVDAKLQVDAYRSEILPKAKRTFDLISKGYSAGEIDFLQLLTAQRTYVQTKLSYLDSMRRFWHQNAMIQGLLLNGSLE